MFYPLIGFDPSPYNHYCYTYPQHVIGYQSHHPQITTVIPLSCHVIGYHITIVMLNITAMLCLDIQNILYVVYLIKKHGSRIYICIYVCINGGNLYKPCESYISRWGDKTKHQIADTSKTRVGKDSFF